MPGLRRRVKNLAEKVSARLVTALGDTSSDTPDSRSAPKRQVYEEWLAEQEAAKRPAPPPEKP
jgi:hypothetical protein